MKDIKLEITNLGMNFEGIARSEGKVFFVPFALPGENVQAEIVDEKAKFNKCKLNKVLTVSKDRVKPFCPYFEKCGGCDLQHLSYAKQLFYKQRHIKETIEKQIDINVELDNVVPSDNVFYYRNKGAFSVSDKIGMFEASSHKVIDVKQCFLMKDEITSAYQITKKFLEDFNMLGYDFNKQKGNVKYIVIRSKADTTLVCLVLKNKIDNLDILYNRLKQKLKNVGLYLNYNNLKNSDILTNNFEHILGEKTIRIDEFGVSYNIDMASFMQVNDAVKHKLYNAILQEVDNKIVIDAYAGAGLLSAILSQKAKKVYSVEIVKEATKLAEQLKRTNNIKNMEVINGDCSEVLPKITRTLNEFIAVIDPARAGCDNKVLTAISNADKILYVSCNPITLARDLKTLLNTHEIVKITPFDMFPQAKHVEALVILKKKNIV